MRILIVKTSGLGDIVNALPVLDYLHQAVPGVLIDWVVEEQFRDILEGSPLLNRLHLLRTKGWRKKLLARVTLHEIAALKTALRKGGYEIVFDIQGNLKSGLVCWLTGAGNIIGFDRDDLNESLNLLFTTRQLPLRSIDRHVSEKYLRIVSVPFGKDFRELQLRSDIYTSPEDDAAADTLMATLSDGFVFIFHTGTTCQTKLWSIEGWVELGKRVLDTFPETTVLLPWGNEAERAVVLRIAAGIGTGARVMDRYSLKGYTAILKRVDLVIGGDTGPVQIAAAVGTPTVSFYRSSDGSSSGPRGERHVVIQSPLHCTRCFRSRCDRDAECRDSVTVEAVLTGIASILV
jgi:heptosyltransferase-1